MWYCIPFCGWSLYCIIVLIDINEDSRIDGNLDYFPHLLKIYVILHKTPPRHQFQVTQWSSIRIYYVPGIPHQRFMALKKKWNMVTRVYNYKIR